MVWPPPCPGQRNPFLAAIGEPVATPPFFGYALIILPVFRSVRLPVLLQARPFTFLQISPPGPDGSSDSFLVSRQPQVDPGRVPTIHRPVSDKLPAPAARRADRPSLGGFVDPVPPVAIPAPFGTPDAPDLIRSMIVVRCVAMPSRSDVVNAPTGALNRSRSPSRYSCTPRSARQRESSSTLKVLPPPSHRRSIVVRGRVERRLRHDRHSRHLETDRLDLHFLAPVRRPARRRRGR